jgi:hypothetical protein
MGTFSYVYGLVDGWRYDVEGNEIDYPGFPDKDSNKDGKKTLYKINKNQLRKKSIPYELPDSMKKIYTKLEKAFQKQDETLLANIREMPSSVMLVKKEHLNSPGLHEKNIKPEDIHTIKATAGPQVRPGTDPLRAATLLHRMNSIQIDGEEHQTELQASHTSPEMAKAKPALKVNRTAMRFRDWNPDVKTAVKKGVSIRYNSTKNIIACPELGISSVDVSFRNGRGGSFKNFGESSNGGTSIDTGASLSESTESVVTSSGSGTKKSSASKKKKSG